MLKQQLISKFWHLPIAHKAALLSASCSFIVMVVLIINNYQANHRLIEYSSQLFADSLAQQLARDARTPLVQDDKLSLQSLLNKLVESPLVVQGAIYNIENRLITESGQKNPNGKTLSAPITFQDSIAGYALITLDTTTLQQQAFNSAWYSIWVALLLSGLSYLLCLFPARYISAALKDLTVIVDSPPHQDKLSSQMAYKGEDELQQLARKIIHRPTQSRDTLCTNTVISSKTEKPVEHAILTVEIANLNELEQRYHPAQLSGKLVNFHRQLKMICNLYNGNIHINRSNGLYILFKSSDNEDSHPFRALCSGYLIMQWAQQQSFIIRQSLVLDCPTENNRKPDNPITLANQNNSDNSMEQQLQQQYIIEQAMVIAAVDNKLLLPRSVYHHPSIEHKVVLEDEQSEQANIVSIKKMQVPYGALLDRQLSTLQTQKANAK